MEVPVSCGNVPRMVEDYHEHLRKVPLFHSLSDDELDAVSRVATDLHFPAGTVLMREGDVGREMFVVASGTVEVTRNGEHVATIDAGGFAGELALLTNSERNATATTTSDVELIHIDGRSFDALLAEVPHIAVVMLPIVASRVHESHEDYSR